MSIWMEKEQKIYLYKCGRVWSNLINSSMMVMTIVLYFVEVILLGDFKLMWTF
jgi:hypothetical protein